MKRFSSFLIALTTLLAMSVSAAISTTFTQGENLSKTTDTATVSVAVAGGDIVVYAISPNKKLSVATYTFTETSADGAALGTRTNVNVTEGFGGTGDDVNPTLWMAYAEVTAAGTLDVTVTDDAFLGDDSNGSTANWGVYVVSGTNLQVITTTAAELAYTDTDFATEPVKRFTLTYDLGATYSDVLVIDILGGTKCDINPAADNIIGTDGELAGDPLAFGWDFVADRRLIGDALVAGESTTISTTYDVTLQSGKTGGITGSALGIAIAGDAGSTGRTWYGYELDENDWTDTGGWLGWVNLTNDPWAYSLTLDTWMYVSSTQSGETGLWMFFVK